MQKNIRYTGYTAVPSDYDSPDGDLALSLNLINEDSALRSVPKPNPVLSVAYLQKIIAIHRVTGQTNLIIADYEPDGSFTLCWMEWGTDTPAPDALPSTADSHLISTKSFSGFRDLAIIGNTLILATDDGLCYILWKDNAYKALGNRPPFIPISFGAYFKGRLNDTSTTQYSDVPSHSYKQFKDPTSVLSFQSTSDDEAFLQTVSNQVFGLLLDSVAKNVTAKGYIYQPLYVRYAFRLYDGSYSWHSAPVLLLVTTKPPEIKIESSDLGSSKLSVKCTLNTAYYGISYKILNCADSLKDWADIVTGIDIFLSAPIYTYRQDKSIIGPVQEAYFNFGSAGESTAISLGTTFLGHFGNDMNSEYFDRFISFAACSPTKYLCGFKPNEEFDTDIQNVANFYRVASIDTKDLKQMAAYENLPLTSESILSNLVTLPRLTDEYLTHAIYRPARLHAYNQRLMLCDYSLTPPAPFPLSVTAAATSLPAQPNPSRYSIRVYTRVSGVPCVSSVSDDTLPIFDDFPRFIYHPDPAAYLMEIYYDDGTTCRLPLKHHPFLNGSFWYGGLGTEPLWSEQSEDSFVTNNSAITPTSVPVADKIYVSEVSNPFVFPPSAVVSIGCGKIMNLSSAARALSQGQFGQFPLYAFTDTGVWAMEVASDGTFSARQPITRDVCINPDSVTQIDTAVLFATARGIMLISGSQTTCLTDTIDGPDCVPNEVRKNLSELCPGLPILSPFRDFLSGCGILYDYTNQRIIIYNPAQTYAYIYSLKSKLWAIIDSTIRYTVAAYPDALAVTSGGGNLVNYSATTPGTRVGGILITRPLKLDAPDVLKTVNTIIQRGNFAKGSVQSILYGSRDLYNWHLIWSSKDHFMRGFRGTPYKYFRVALLTNLSATEFLSGMSLDYIPRLTNQPR